MELIISPTPETGEKISKSYSGTYRCPFCDEQASDDTYDIGWVECPILNYYKNRHICLGCCIDIGQTCRADNFEQHLYKDIVEDAAYKAGLDLLEARRICLNHQYELLESDSKIDEKQKEEKLKEILKKIEEIYI